jgi:amino acid transporter
LKGDVGILISGIVIGFIGTLLILMAVGNLPDQINRQWHGWVECQEHATVDYCDQIWKYPSYLD